MRSSFNKDACKQLTQDEFVKKHQYLYEVEGVSRKELETYLKQWYKINIGKKDVK